MCIQKSLHAAMRIHFGTQVECTETDLIFFLSLLYGYKVHLGHLQAKDRWIKVLSFTECSLMDFSGETIDFPSKMRHLHFQANALAFLLPPCLCVCGYVSMCVCVWLSPFHASMCICGNNPRHVVSVTSVSVANLHEMALNKCALKENESDCSK